MSSKAELRVLTICHKLTKQQGRMLKLGEVVQEGDLLCSMPDDMWIPATAIGLVISPYDLGWYRRPGEFTKGASN